LFGGEPQRVHAEAVYDDDGVDLRMAASMRLEHDVLGQLDVGLTHTRRDELELVGSTGSLVVPDPWIGVSAALGLRRGTTSETIPVDLPAGSRLGLEEGAVYRLELDLVSRAALAGTPLPFGRADAVAQAATLEALDASARSGSRSSRATIRFRPLPGPEGARVLGLGPTAWTLLAVAALMVGFAKTAVGGVAAISVAVFAAVLPARESTGVLLPLLLVGDVVAVRSYRAHAHWGTLLRLLPAVVVGVLVGVVFVDGVGDTVMRRTIGVILLGLLLHVVLRRRGDGLPARGGSGLWHHVATGGYGLLAGFTTMVGGSVMSLYLLSSGLSVLGFLGTTAWFFFLVNLFKVPFSIGLGLLSTSSLVLDAMLVPCVLVGTYVGRRVIGRIDQKRFESLVLVFTALSTVPLLR
jgi:hypothetical protein